MPNDSAYINNKAKAKNTYDAIIVGSGISGGWAAKELCEKGLNVLLLERGANISHPIFARKHNHFPSVTRNEASYSEMV